MVLKLIIMFLEWKYGLKLVEAGDLLPGSPRQPHALVELEPGDWALVHGRIREATGLFRRPKDLAKAS